LNGFWGDGIGSDEANQIWLYVEKFVELDKVKNLIVFLIFDIIFFSQNQFV
jgi:hypothetical protein